MLQLCHKNDNTFNVAPDELQRRRLQQK